MFLKFKIHFFINNVPVLCFLNNSFHKGFENSLILIKRIIYFSRQFSYFHQFVREFFHQVPVLDCKVSFSSIYSLFMSFSKGLEWGIISICYISLSYDDKRESIKLLCVKVTPTILCQRTCKKSIFYDYVKSFLVKPLLDQFTLYVYEVNHSVRTFILKKKVNINVFVHFCICFIR